MVMDEQGNSIVVKTEQQTTLSLNKYITLNVAVWSVAVVN